GLLGRRRAPRPGRRAKADRQVRRRDRPPAGGKGKRRHDGLSPAKTRNQRPPATLPHAQSREASTHMTHTSSTLSVPLPGLMPRHIAIIMDGNGRWATSRYLPRVAGHAKGVEKVRDIVQG